MLGLEFRYFSRYKINHYIAPCQGPRERNSVFFPPFTQYHLFSSLCSPHTEMASEFVNYMSGLQQNALNERKLSSNRKIAVFSFIIPSSHRYVILEASCLQFSGINGVLYYTPQILEQAGVGVLLSSMGIGSASASLLISAITTLLMLPSIAVAMRLMDISGRR